MLGFLKSAAAVVIVAVVTPLVAAGTVLGAQLFLPLPATLPERTPPAPSQISRVYDAAGNQIGTFKQFETSIPVEQRDIPQSLKDAVIAAEDQSFYSHGGVDVRGTIRALLSDVRNREVAQGGSTITQQLVKNTLTGNERSIQRKVREAILASQLDRQVEKDDILFEYLSVIYLGEGAYGVGAAAETYFRKPVSELTLSESALLAGLIPAPSRYSPRVDPAAAERKRLIVLAAMLDQELITQQEHDGAVYQPVFLAGSGPAPAAGFATVVHPAEGQASTDPYFTDYVYRWLRTHLPGGEDQILRGGLTITTTLDPAIQRAAHAEVGSFLDGTDPELRTSLVSVEPPTGFVRAFVSGRDFATDRVNYALGSTSAGDVGGGGSGRQPGSAFKPFVLAQALAAGITPDTRYSGGAHDVSQACPGTEKPLTNYEGGGGGTYDLRGATARSINTVYTRLILDVGVDKTMALARSMGLSSVRAYDPAVHCASVALGAESVSPLDMASAYGVFAARGQRVEPTPVLRVVDRDGEVLIDNSTPEATRVLAEPVADNVTAILQGVLTSGTASGRGIDRPAAGKTGTAQNNRDAWFVGYTPSLSTAVWIGYVNRTEATARELEDIKGVANVTGGSWPARIWQAFMRQALDGVPATTFTEPAPIVAVPDAVVLRQRQGFAPGRRMSPSGAPPSGGFVEDPGVPVADPPTTTTEAPSTTTEPSTTTTEPEEDDDDGGGVFNRRAGPRWGR